MADNCPPLTTGRREKMIDGLAQLLPATLAEEGYSGARVEAERILADEFKKMETRAGRHERCPHCGHIWGIKEREEQICGNCSYPNVGKHFEYLSDKGTKEKA